MRSERRVPRPVVIGEVLFDSFPDGSNVLGGAPFNVAWHLRGLGLDPYFVSRVGDDNEGRQVLAAMRDWDMDTAGVEKDSTRPTGGVAVTFNDGQPSYEILPDQAYDAISLQREVPGAHALIYHGTLALRSQATRAAVESLRARDASPVFLDVNLRAPWWTPESVAALVSGARWCKLNDEELEVLAGSGKAEEAAQKLLDLHGLEWLFVTEGAKGAFALGRGGSLHRVAPRSDTEVVDTVGAGDAFAATLIAGLLLEWPIPVALSRAQDVASAVCGQRGAVPRDPAFYERQRSAWARRT